MEFDKVADQDRPGQTRGVQDRLGQTRVTCRPLRVPEGTRYPVFKITTRTLPEKFYYPAG